MANLCFYTNIWVCLWLWCRGHMSTKIWFSQNTLTFTMSFRTKAPLAIDFTPAVHGLITGKLVRCEAFGLWGYDRSACTGGIRELSGAGPGGWWWRRSSSSSGRSSSSSCCCSCRWRSIPYDGDVCTAVELLLWSVTETTQATDSIHTPVVSCMKGEGLMISAISAINLCFFH